jgi:hypothetical protein
MSQPLVLEVICIRSDNLQVCAGKGCFWHTFNFLHVQNLYRYCPGYANVEQYQQEENMLDTRKKVTSKFYFDHMAKAKW